jgi:hypothetical protein
MDLPHGNACFLQAYPAQTADDVNLDLTDLGAVALLRELDDIANPCASAHEASIAPGITG